MPTFDFDSRFTLAKRLEKGKIVDFTSSNHNFLIATHRNIVFRCNFKLGQLKEYHLSFNESSNVKDKIYRLFTDSYGIHVILTSVNGFNYYLNCDALNTPTTSNFETRKSYKEQKATRSSSSRKSSSNFFNNDFVFLSKIKNFRIESVGWNKWQSNLSSTSSILIGTSTGTICEICISNFGREHTFKRLFDLQQSLPFYGLQIEKFPDIEQFQYTKHQASVSSSKQLICASTLTHYYQFVGGPTFTDVFNEFDTSQKLKESSSQSSLLSRCSIEISDDDHGLLIAAITGDSDKHVSGGKGSIGGCGKLLLQSKNRDQRASFCAWLTCKGIFFGSLIFGSQKSGDKVVSDYKIIKYPNLQQQDTNNEQKGSKASEKSHYNIDFLDNSFERSISFNHTIPISFSITEFHLILCYRTGIIVLNHVSEEVVFRKRFYWRNDPLHSNSNNFLTSLYYDSTTSTHQAATQMELFEITIRNEYEHIQKVYLGKKMFNEARKYCQDNHKNMQNVFCEEADYHFSSKRYGLAAEKYAKLDWKTLSFEHIALKFVEKCENDALIKYLKLKLALISSKHKMQRTLISTQIVDIYLYKIYSFSSIDDKQNLSTLSNILTGFNENNDDTNNSTLITKQNDILLDFRNFIKENFSDLNRSTIVDLLMSYGLDDELLFYLEIIGDFNYVLDYWSQRFQWRRVLDVLLSCINNTSLSQSTIFDLVYKFGPRLLTKLPCATVDMLIQNKSIEPAKFLSSIVTPIKKEEQFNLNSEFNKQIIRYLNQCIKENLNKDSIIHNYLIILYAYTPRNDQSQSLLDFIDWSITKHGKCPIFDPNFALRICLRRSKYKACVKLFLLLNCYEKAVEYALKVDVDHARKIIGNCDALLYDVSLRRRIWIRVFEHLICVEKDVEGALKLLNQNDDISQTNIDCYGIDGCVTIEDILDLIASCQNANFTCSISSIKNEIENTLEIYSKNVERLNIETKQYIENIDRLSSEIETFSNQSFNIDPNTQCSICKNSITSLPNINQISVFNLTQTSTKVLDRLDQSRLLIFPCLHAFHSFCYYEKFKQRNVDICSKQNITQNNAINEECNYECLLCGNFIIEEVYNSFIDKSLICTNDFNNQKL